MIKKTKKPHRWLKGGFIALCVLVGLVGVLLIFLDPIKAFFRKQYSNQAIKAFEQGESTFVVPDNEALSVDGEYGEEDIAPYKFLLDLGTMADEYETLTLVGLMEIPELDITEPVFQGVSYNALRYGVGVFPGTVNPGETGLCSLWGHRDPSVKTMLWNLEHCQDMIGEKVYVTTMDYVRREYEIVECVYVKDAAMMPYMSKDTYDSEMLCIVTCGYGTDYKGVYHEYNTEFVVICKPLGTEQLDKPEM